LGLGGKRKQIRENRTKYAKNFLWTPKKKREKPKKKN
jgi:hypothetical protein